MTVPWRFSEKKCGVKCSRSRKGISLWQSGSSRLLTRSAAAAALLLCCVYIVHVRRFERGHAECFYRILPQHVNSLDLPSPLYFVLARLRPASSAGTGRLERCVRRTIVRSPYPAPNTRFLSPEAHRCLCVLFVCKAWLILTGEGHRLHPARGQQVESCQLTGLLLGICLPNQFRQRSPPHQDSQCSRYARDTHTHSAACPQ